MKNKETLKKVFLLLVALALLAGASYAYIYFNFSSKKTNVITAGCLKLELTENNTITLSNSVPLTDNQGKKLEPFTYTITNTCTLAANYKTTFNVLTTSGTGNESKTKIFLLGDTYVAPKILSNFEGIVLTDKPNDVRSSYIIDTGIIEPGEVKSFDLRMWIDYNATSYDDPLDAKILIDSIATTPNLDKSGANQPRLVKGMIPVYYDETQATWKIADKMNRDVNNQWYSYATNGETKGMWANAVLVKETGTVHNRDYYTNQANVGQTVSMDDILQMYVWIPRFVVNTTDFTIISGEGTQILSINEDENGRIVYYTPQAIDISFVNNDMLAHDAFTFDGNKAGFWVGKFETSHTTLASNTTNNNLNCSTETCESANEIIIKPNVTSLRYNNVSNFFYASRSIEQPNNLFGIDGNEVDTHMMKNNEWGAVAYLSHSMYGRCASNTTCTELSINNCSNCITGIGGNTIDAEESVTTCTSNINKYNGEKGMLSSTTGNIYGIYDMSGGSTEYVMGIYNYAFESENFDITGINNKYINKYADLEELNGTYHAIWETSDWYYDSIQGYQTIRIGFDLDIALFSTRSNYYSETSKAGIFGYANNSGYANELFSSRNVIVK